MTSKITNATNFVIAHAESDALFATTRGSGSVTEALTTAFGRTSTTATTPGSQRLPFQPVTIGLQRPMKYGDAGTGINAKLRALAAITLHGIRQPKIVPRKTFG